MNINDHLGFMVLRAKNMARKYHKFCYEEYLAELYLAVAEVAHKHDPSRASFTTFINAFCPDEKIFRRLLAKSGYKCRLKERYAKTNIMEYVKVEHLSDNLDSYSTSDPEPIDNIDLSNLDPRQAAVVRLYFAGYNTVQLGKHFGITKEAVRARLKKGLEALRWRHVGS